MRLLPLMLLSLWLSAAGLQAQSFLLQGTITDAESQEPLTGAAVSVPALSIGTYTDAQGSYQLKFSPPEGGKVVVEIRYAGYRSETREIPLTGESFTLDLALAPDGFMADDVVITATKGFEQKESDVTVSISTVKPRSIDLQATPDIGRVINQIPGVDEQDGQINIRGSSGYAYGVGSRVMVTLDGLPLLTGDAGTATLNLIPVDNIARVEVMKGASSVLYGSAALGGVINVITADPGEKPLTSVRLRGTLYDHPRNENLIWNPDSRTYEGSAHVFHSRRIGEQFFLTGQLDLIKNSGYRQGTDQEQIRGLIMTKFKPKSVPGLTLGLNLSGRIDSSGQILYWRGYFPDTLEAPNGETVVEGGALTPTNAEGGFRKQFGTYLAIDPSAKYLTANGNLFWYRGRFLRNTNANNTGQSNQNYIFYNDFLYQTTLAKNLNWVSGATVTFAEANGDSLYGGRHPGYEVGVYTQLDGKFGPLNTSLGFRYQTVKIDTLDWESRPVFRAGLNYKVAEGTNLRASFGQAFRVPTVAERFANTAGGAILIEPNPTIGSEYGYSVEIGGRQGYRLDNGNLKWEGYLDVAAFQMDYQNMVEFGIRDVSIGFAAGAPRIEAKFTSVNVARARIRGLEFTTINNWSWGEGWQASLSGGLTLTDPVNLNAVPDSQQLDLSGYPNNILRLLDDINDPNIVDQPAVLKYRQRVLVRTSATIGYGRVSLTTNLRYRSFTESIDQFLYAVVPDLGYFRETYDRGDFDATFIGAFDLSDQSTLSVTVDNVFNNEYLIIPGLLAPQRRATLQYLVRF